MFTGTLVLGLGLMVGMNGRRMFGHTVSAIGGIGAFIGLLFLVSMCGGTDTDLGWYITLGFSVAIGIAASIFFWRTARFAVELLGIVNGTFLSTLLYTVLAVTTGFGPEWFFWSLMVLGAGAGGVLAWKKPNYVTMYATTIIGAYLCMRAAAIFFEN